MNMYTAHQYQPFDNYSSQALSNTMITTPPALTYVSNSVNNKSTTSSTLVNLLHQKRPTLIEQSSMQGKPTTPTKQTRKSTPKKPVVKRLATSTTSNTIQVISNRRKRKTNLSLLFQHFPNPNHTLLNYPVTQKAKAQSTSTQPFATPSPILTQKFSSSIPEHVTLVASGSVNFLVEYLRMIDWFLIVR